MLNCALQKLLPVQGKYYDELKYTCEKFQRLLCKASAAEESYKEQKYIRLISEKCSVKRSLKNYVCISCDIVLFQFTLLVFFTNI